MLPRIGRYLLIGWLALGGACGPGRGGLSGNPSNDLLQEARSRGIKEPTRDDELLFFYNFSREGIQRQTLVLLPGAVFEVPAQVFSRTSAAHLWIGMPFQLGDGAELTVEIRDRQQAVQTIHMTLDPAHVRRDQRWRLLTIPLGKDADRLRFRVSAGPSGDVTGDWVGLAPYP